MMLAGQALKLEWKLEGVPQGVKLAMGGEMTCWTAREAEPIDFSSALTKLLFRYIVEDELSTLVYQDNLPSWPYWKWKAAWGGHAAWTDWSRKDMGSEKGLKVGYWTFSQTPSLNRLLGHLGLVGWEAVPISGEFAAIAVALKRAPKNKQLAILTDCMSAIDILTRWTWRKLDFRPDADTELHWDIVSDILNSSRTAQTLRLIVWIKGHR